MEALWRYVPLLVDDRSVITLHFSVGLESVGPDLSQWLGEVFNLLDYWFKIAAVVDAELARITRSESRHAATSVN